MFNGFSIQCSGYEGYECKIMLNRRSITVGEPRCLDCKKATYRGGRRRNVFKLRWRKKISTGVTMLVEKEE